MKELKFRIWNKQVGMMWSWEVIRRNSILALDSSLPNKSNFVAFPQPDEDHILMQYTRLKDKNGVEIYEGDILSYTEHWIGDFKYSSGRGVVAYDNGSFYIEDELLTPGLCEEEIENCHMKVLGNVHENNVIEGL